MVLPIERAALQVTQDVGQMLFRHVRICRSARRTELVLQITAWEAVRRLDEDGLHLQLQ